MLGQGGLAEGGEESSEVGDARAWLIQLRGGDAALDVTVDAWSGPRTHWHARELVGRRRGGTGEISQGQREPRGTGRKMGGANRAKRLLFVRGHAAASTDKRADGGGEGSMVKATTRGSG